MELFVFGLIALGVIYVVYKAYGTKKPEAVVTAVVVEEKIEAPAKPAKKVAAKKPTVKKATTRKPKAK